MKEIKVFLASSEELMNERKEIADLILNLNEIYSEKDITIRLIKWEYLGKTYNGVRKQEEYNQAVRSCDIFLGLFYTKAGEFSVEEFDIAIEQYNKSRQTPMILVFLKDLTPTDIEDDSLKSFKSRLANDLGHYWARFNHTDKLKLDIVLQLQRFDIFGQSGQVYVKDSNIYLADGTMVASLENLSFAANNQQWNQLKNEVAKLERKIKRYSTINDLDEEELSDFAEMKKELDDKQKSLQSLEHSMFNTALVIAQSVGTKSSERLRKAQEYFELGDISSANLVLDYQEVMNDTDNNKHLYEQEQKILEVRRENLLLNIQELRMKISLLVSKKQDDFTEEDLSNAIGALDKITDICETIKMDNSEQWTIALEILKQFYSSNKFSSEFIIYIAWIYIHELKKDSIVMGYDSAYRFIIKCILIIAKSYKEDTQYSDTLLRLLSLALEYNKKVYKEDNIERANIFALIGDTYYHRFCETSFRFDEQILLNCSKSKEIRENLLGKDHPDTINITNNVAYYLHRMFYREQAVEIMGSLMDKISSTDNEYRPEEGTYIVDSRFNVETVHYVFNTALYYGNYADLLRDNEKYEDAIIWYEKALDVEKTNYDSLCGYMARMGRCHVELENYDRGIECMQQSLKMATAYSGVEPMTDDENNFYWYWSFCADSEGMSFPLVYMISFAYYKDGNYEDSIKYAIKYLELNLRAQKWNESNPYSLLKTFDIAEAYRHLGFVYYEAGLYEKSIAALENALNVLQGRKDYMTEAPSVLDLLVNACNLNKETEKAGMYANELDRINTTVEEDPLLYEPSISTLVLVEKKELPNNVTLEAGDYIMLKYGDYEVGKNVAFDKIMQDEYLKDLVILKNKIIRKYYTSLKHCGFILNTSAVDADSVNTLIEGLNKFKANEEDNGPLYNPFVYSIEIKEPLNTACGNVIPSGVYPLYKYGAFEVGKFQQPDKYIREYDLPQITIIQIGNELHGFGVRLKGHKFSLITTYKNSNVVKEHVDRLQKFLGERYIPDEVSVFLTIGPTIKFELPLQIGNITIPSDETYNLIQMGDYEIGNLNEPDMSSSESFVILTNDYGFLQIDSKGIEGVMDYTITTYQVEKELVERIRKEYEEWKQQRDLA